jgi:hypothetical protein
LSLFMDSIQDRIALQKITTSFRSSIIYILVG